jgi:aminocyclopropanecarboxylate oxidase
MASTLLFPIIDMGLLDGQKRPAMELLRDACENWGFFEVDMSCCTIA